MHLECILRINPSTKIFFWDDWFHMEIIRKKISISSLFTWVCRRPFLLRCRFPFLHRRQFWKSTTVKITQHRWKGPRSVPIKRSNLNMYKGYRNNINENKFRSPFKPVFRIVNFLCVFSYSVPLSYLCVLPALNSMQNNNLKSTRNYSRARQLEARVLRSNR